MDGVPYRRVARIPVLRIQPASDLSVHDSGERAANDLLYYRLVVLLAPMDPASTLERSGIRGSFCLRRDVDALRRLGCSGGRSRTDSDRNAQLPHQFIDYLRWRSGRRPNALDVVQPRVFRGPLDVCLRYRFLRSFWITNEDSDGRQLGGFRRSLFHGFRLLLESGARLDRSWGNYRQFDIYPARLLAADDCSSGRLSDHFSLLYLQPVFQHRADQHAWDAEK